MKLLKLGALTSRLPNGVTRTAGRTGFLAKKHSPVILFTAGVVGVVTTVVLASKATLHLDEVLNESTEEQNRVHDAFNDDTGDNKNYNDPDKYKRDIFTIRAATAGKLARLYLPAVIVGMVSIAALTGSHVILTRRNFGLSAAFAGLDKAYHEYRRRVSSEFGEEKERELFYGVETQTVTETVVNEDGTTSVVEKQVKVLNKDAKGLYTFWFDEVNSDNWSREPLQNRVFLNCQLDAANYVLKSRGYLFLNEVLIMLGLDPVPHGQIVGWLHGADQDGTGDGYVDFGFFIANGEVGAMNWINGYSTGVRLDFNVQGNILQKFTEKINK